MIMTNPRSAKFDKVKSYYDRGLWTVKMVRDAVVKEWITEDEYKSITGLDFEE